MYEGASGERFTLYCSRAAVPDSALHFRTAGQAAAFYWTDEGFTYVVSGPADRSRLQKVAESAYAQLENRPVGGKAARRSTLAIR
jgi:anti-sigma factor RsiW